MNDITTQYLKISVKRQLAGKPQIIYNELSTSYNEFFKTCNDLDIQYLFKYWIDDDGDKVEITDDISYQMFIKLSKKKLILVDNGDDEDVNVENLKRRGQILKKDVRTRTSKSKGTKSNNSSHKHYKKPIHEGVACDNCNVHPIVGFRYKCFSCPNFDLCSRCERKKKHYHHKMIRYNEPAKHASLFEELSINSLNNKDSKLGNDYNVRKSIRNGANNAFHNLFEMMEGMANDDSLNNTDNSSVVNIKKKVEIKKKNYNNNNSYSDSTDTDNSEDSEDVEKNKKQENYIDIDVSNIESNNLNNSEKKEKTESHSTNIFPDDGTNRYTDTKINRIKAGVQALGSFGNIFQLLVPPKITTQPKEEEHQQQQPVTHNLETPTAPDQDKRNIDQIKINSNTNIEVGSLIDFDLTSMDGAVGGFKSQNPGLRELSPDDIGWTVIEKTVDTSRDKTSTFEKKSGSSEELGNGNNHAQNHRSNDVLNPIEKRNKENIVYHKNPKINKSVIAMIAMGFCNEENLLVDLLESVNGDICQALDTIQKSPK